MKKILLACGTGIATSTAVAKKLEKALDERGWAGKYQITQCTVAEVPSKSENVDLCVATTQVQSNVKCPVVMGIPFLTGIGIAPVVDQIVAILEQ